MATVIAPPIPKPKPPDTGPDAASGEELYKHCTQRVAPGKRIHVSRRAWTFRLLFLAAMVGFMVFNIRLALSIGDSLIIYSTIMPIHALLILGTGWFFFKSRATGAVPDDLVSIIIPVYNQETLIKGVIEAIFASSYPNIEVVAVNDGSRDNTAQVLDELEAANPALTVIHKPNGGKRTAVAAGFYAAKGDFLVLIDSDSIVDKYAIEEFMKVFSANPRAGGLVGNGKVLNTHKNLLTRCQDVWYDFAFNIHKTTESTFGTVLCLSGCLAAYRREAVEPFVAIWAADKAQYGDDRNLTAYAMATPWAKGQLAPLERRLLKGMADYDDAEDRGLTSHTMLEWETLYIPTAVVSTEVPDNWRTYLRQQVRWRKGYLRSTFFISAFFWRKNPLMAFIFYLEFMSSIIGPLITASVFLYGPLVLHTYLYPILYLAGQASIGLAQGLDYKFRVPTSRVWMYMPMMNFISAVVLPWVLFPAVWGFRRNGWLTR